MWKRNYEAKREKRLKQQKEWREKNPDYFQNWCKENSDYFKDRAKANPGKLYDASKRAQLKAKILKARKDDLASTGFRDAVQKPIDKSHVISRAATIPRRKYVKNKKYLPISHDASASDDTPS
jgi:hypothetical protein